jgi:hypothetical protein
MSSENWTYWIHLPGVVLADETDLSWAEGSLCALDHEAWHELDQTTWQPSDYAETRPVFYRCMTLGEVDGMAPDRRVFATIRERRSRAHRALALVCSWPPPPDPELSCVYMTSDRDTGIESMIVGPGGRDWILTGRYRSPRHELSLDTLAKAEATYKQLQYLSSVLPGTLLEGALQALSLSSLPDVYVGDGGPPRNHLAFIGTVAALERLLVEEDSTTSEAPQSITTAFARHAAVLLSVRFDSMADLFERLKRVYRLRSDLIHGRRGLDTYDPVQTTTLSLGLAVFPWILRATLALMIQGIPVTDWPGLLAGAAVDRERFDALCKQLLMGGLR